MLFMFFHYQIILHLLRCGIGMWRPNLHVIHPMIGSVSTS